MSETSIDTANNTDNDSNRNPFSVSSLCYSEQKRKRIPVYPYVVAFTGHRNFIRPGEIDGVRGYTDDEVKNRFKKELEGLAKLWKNKSGGCAPLILLTGLADGSDQIITQAALELKNLNVKVIAVLPMDRDTFELTIHPENKQKYRDLLKQVDDVYELPLEDDIRGHESELKNICDETEDFRRVQYRCQAEFLSLHSHIHFVVWDGVNIDSQGGGTGETVMFKLEGNTRLTSSNLLTFSSIGPVVHFLIPRKNNINREPFSSDLNWDEIPVFYWTRDRLRQLGKSQPDRSVMNEAYRLHTSVAKIEEVVKVIKNIGALNIDGKKISEDASPENEEKKQQTWDLLFGIGTTPEEKVPETAQKIRDRVNQYIDYGTRVFIDHYVIADMLASEYKEKTGKTITAYSIAAFSFLLISGLISLLGDFSNIGGSTTAYKIFSYIFLTVYELALLVTLTIFAVSSIWRFHYKYHYYRSMAEALRIQIFWRIALLPSCVSGFYRSHQIFKTEWLRAAINSIDVLIPSPQNESVDSTQNRIDIIKEMWIEEQQRFLAKRIFEKRKTSWIDLITHPYVMITYTVLALFFAPFIGFFHQLAFNWTGNSIIKSIIVFVTALYVSYTIYAQKSMNIAEANRYERELFPFDRAALLLSKNLTTDSKEEIKIKQDVLRQLGEEALAGNSDWLLSAEKRSLTLRNIKIDKE